MCDALIGLFGQDGTRDVTIEFNPGKGERLFAPETFRFQFKSEEVPTLRFVSDYFKQTYTLSDFEVVGYIKRLDRDLYADAGSVWVHASLPDRQEKNIHVQLSEKDYQSAIHAHDSKSLVRCVGDIFVSPRSARLVNLKRFDVVAAGDLF